MFGLDIFGKGIVLVGNGQELFPEALILNDFCGFPDLSRLTPIFLGSCLVLRHGLAPEFVRFVSPNSTI